MVEVAFSTSALKIYTHRDGSAAVCETCCKGVTYELGEPCVYCPTGTTPKTVQAIVTNITDCAGCLNSSFPAPQQWPEEPKSWDNFDVAKCLNRTYILTQDSSNPCLWLSSWIDDTSGSIRIWKDPNCAGDTFTRSTIRVRARLIKTASTWFQFSIRLDIENIAGYAYYGFNCIVSRDAGTCITGDDISFRAAQCSTFIYSLHSANWGFTENGDVIVTPI